MRNSIRKIVDGLNVGDLILVEWCDASMGKSGDITDIDVPAKSWGIYMGLFGDKTKHIVIAQNSYRYSDGLSDLDFTAVPVGWATNCRILDKGHVPKQASAELTNSFLRGGHHRGGIRRRIFQRRLTMHGRSN